MPFHKTKDDDIFRKYEVIHTRHKITMSFWDRIKVLFGFPTDVSICIAVEIRLENGQYKGLGVAGVEDHVAIWKCIEPATVEAKELNKRLH